MWPWHDVHVVMFEGSLAPLTKDFGIDDPLPFDLKIWEAETLSNLDTLVSNLMHPC